MLSEGTNDIKWEDQKFQVNALSNISLWMTDSVGLQMIDLEGVWMIDSADVWLTNSKCIFI